MFNMGALSPEFLNMLGMGGALQNLPFNPQAGIPELRQMPMTPMDGRPQIQPMTPPFQPQPTNPVSPTLPLPTQGAAQTPGNPPLQGLLGLLGDFNDASEKLGTNKGFQQGMGMLQQNQPQPWQPMNVQGFNTQMNPQLLQMLMGKSLY